MAVGICAHSVTEALVRQALTLGQEAWRVAGISVHPKDVWWGLRSGFCTGH